MAPPPAPGLTRLTRRATLGYGVGAAGTAGFGTVPGLLLAIYLTDTLGVAAGLASLVVLVPKLWDVVFLPIVGNLSDRSVSRTGNRAHFLAFGALGILVSFPLMFAVPAGLAPGAAAAWVFLTFLLAATAFGVFQVPYIALAAEITDSPWERTTLMSWRVGFQVLGILAFGIGAPVLVGLFPSANTGYLVMGVLVGALIATGMLVCWRVVRHLRRYVTQATTGGLSPRRQFRIAFASRPFRLLIIAFMLQALGAGAVLAAAPYFARLILGIDNFGIVFGALLAPAVLAMPMWTRIGHRLGKRVGYLAASVIFIVGLTSSLLAGRLPVAAAVGLIAVASVGYAGMQMFPLAMLPDTISADAERRGEQRAGAFTGVWTAAETAAFATGPALVLLLLSVSGYVSSTAGQTVVQSATAISGVQLAFSVMPVILVAMSLPIIWRYPLRG